MADDGSAPQREQMVQHQIIGRGVHDPAVVDAMRTVPRHRFVPERVRRHAYGDHPQPIGHGSTISQPYIVASMSELARIGPDDRVLDVGTGSGYQAAVLAQMGAKVWSIERVAPLARRAAEILSTLGYGVQVHHADGYEGWPDAAPYRAIVVAAAAPRVPPALLDQLALGGRLVMPVGDPLDQELVVIERTELGFSRKRQYPVLFVELIEGRVDEAADPSD